MSTLPLESMARASHSTVGGSFRARAREYPDRIAIQSEAAHGSALTPLASITYRELDARVAQLAGGLASLGVTRGARLALLSENRAEYLEIVLAAARLGASVACQNWELPADELGACVTQANAAVVLVSPRHAERIAGLTVEHRIMLGDEYERWLQTSVPLVDDRAVLPEDPLLIAYTSYSRARPQAARVSHRAEIWRNIVVRAEFGISPRDTFAAWSPLCHVGALEPALGVLMSGGKVITVDGFDAAGLAELVARESLGWLLLLPGMVGSFADELERRRTQPQGIKLCGGIADRVPPADIARITRLLDAPYANGFSSLQAGCLPCGGSRIPIGVTPTRLSKEQSAFCEVRIVDPEDGEVAVGTPGELCLRAPTLFSGYHEDSATEDESFRGGWFHTGDVFVRNADGTLDYIDRRESVIECGGAAVYPAQIERVLLQDERVIDAAVVRRPDAKWGEVPVAFVARYTEYLEAADLYRRCRRDLLSHQQPKDIFFIQPEEFPRTVAGQIDRHELAKRLATQPVGSPRPDTLRPSTGPGRN